MTCFFLFGEQQLSAMQCSELHNKQGMRREGLKGRGREKEREREERERGRDEMEGRGGKRGKRE